MRQSYTDLTLLTHDDHPYGVALGTGHCAEHEQGIEGLTHLLEATHPDALGIDQFLALPQPAGAGHIGLYERTKSTKTIAAETRLVVHPHPDTVAALTAPKPAYALPVVSVRNGQANKPLAAAWNHTGFCLRAFGDQERAVVHRLYAALFSGNLLVSMSSHTNPFARGGLCLSLRDGVPEPLRQQAIQSQRAHHTLHANAARTGIAARLEAAGKRIRFLTPKALGPDQTVGRPQPDGTTAPVPLQSAHPVFFYLIPADTRTAKSGWYSVEDLDAWIQGNGPVTIPKG